MLHLVAIVTVFSGGLLSSLRWNGFQFHHQFLGRLVLSLFLVALPPHAIVPSFWPLLTWILAHYWPRLFPNTPLFLRHGGPLGPGCAKLVSLASAGILYKAVLRTNQPFPVQILPTTNTIHLQTWILLILFSFAVNGVLYTWSRYYQTRGKHHGVHETVQSSIGRSLQTKEQLTLAAWAIGNAIAEEVAARGIWRHELTQVMGPRYANIAQAIVFGVGHYHGIPSGWSGVALTLVYGWMMGLWQDQGGCLLLPIVTHAVTDYFIFSFIARQTTPT